ncbi:MAG TPA: heavy metal-binding domain-containing protein [Solirubrobacteraceae bacterium]|nr:heavy metal-binding domain-containing protein [Solirubrobacteraceae bacterium]
MGLLDRLRGAAGGGGGGDDGDGEARERRRAEDIARIERGSVPIAAENRLRELGAGKMGFTSGLSVADFALTRLESIRPVCQVMGTSVYKVGWQNYPWTTGWGSSAVLTELTALTHAWNDARARALHRLREEASHAGCHAVVDVTFENRAHAFLNDEIEILVNGTAVHLPEGIGEDGVPVLTDLSMPDYVLLRRGGYAPVGVVASTSVFYIVPSRQTRRMTTGWQRMQPNQELRDFTQGVYEARENAISRATEQARALGAGGLVGMTVDHHIAIREVEQNDQKREDLIVTFHIIGTAIAPHGEHEPLDPQTILRLGAKTRP